MKTKDKSILLSKLLVMHPNPVCELHYKTPFELLVAVILSAQCTDKRVNQVTDKLFVKYNTPEVIATMDTSELEKYIFSCGFYHNKAKNIISAARDIVAKYNGKVPTTIDDLVTLDGVGRKTANVVASNCFNVPAIAIDTHCFRVAHRLGLASGNTPQKVEQELMKEFDKKDWTMLHHLLVHHGRYVCTSRTPNCANCIIQEYCEFYKTHKPNI